MKLTIELQKKLNPSNIIEYEKLNEEKAKKFG